MLLLISGALASLLVCANADEISKGKRELEPFDYKGVTLEPGNLQRQFLEVCEYYLRLPNDDLLKPYRQRAGLDAPGADMGGCYVSHNPFGQFLSGYARMYAVTGIKAYRDKAITLMEGWAQCIAPDGFCFAEKNPQLIPYYYDKAVCGLVDIYAYCGDERALEYLAKITDWAEVNISRARQYANPTSNDGGEWYTLSENLYRAYLLTGDKRYEDFAKVWEYREYWDFFHENRGTEIYTKNTGWYHAYSHVNTFNGLGAAYLAEGDPYYLDTLINAYDYLQQYQCWATGGYGPNECLLPKDKLIEMLDGATNHFETQCGSWACFKMTKYLISLTGDARYGDWTEKLMLNGIGASIPMSGDGKPFYYSEYNLSGSAKHNINAQWPCCSGTRPQAISDYHDILYFKDDDGIYISQFAPSTAQMKIDGATLKITQQTRFPESDIVLVDVKVSSPIRCRIGVRVPGWLAGPLQVWVNGEEQRIVVNSDHWAIFRRMWEDGDTIKIKLPMDLWVSRLDETKAFPAAIMYGPVTMALRPGDENPAEKVDFDNLQASFTISEGEPLTWKLVADPSVLLRPFYAFKENERYFLYLDPAKEIRKKSYRSASYTGEWTDFNGWMTTHKPGSYVEANFTGKGIRIHFYKYDDSGWFEVFVDGKKVGILDTYGPTRGEAAYMDFDGFTDELHTVKLVLLEEKNPASKDNFANVAGFEVIEKAGQ